MLMMRSVTAGLSMTLITMASAMMPPTAQAAVGRIEGNFGVSPTGAATYDIPISLPPGPRGVQPELALTYNSNGGPGILGVGWDLAGLSSIERCNKTVAQDGAAVAVSLSTSDGYCLDGKRLRLTSGVYGTDGSVYQTEIADFSQITSHGSAGNGPQYFTVKAKDGLSYEYGKDGGSRVYSAHHVSGAAAGTPNEWLLNKVYDRYGNNYIITYYGGETGSSGIALPQTIKYTPTGYGSSVYAYTVSFAYITRLAQNANTRFSSTLSYTLNSTAPSDPYQTTNPNLLKTITINYGGGVLVNQYNLAYDNSDTTTVARLVSVQQCAPAVTGTDCLSPTAITYNEGNVTLGTGATIVSTGTHNLKILASRDFNGDGRDDILYRRISSNPDEANQLYVVLSVNTGNNAPQYQAPVPLYIAYAEPNLAPFPTTVPLSNCPECNVPWEDGQSSIGFADLGTGRTDILVPGQNGYWHRFSWNSGTTFDQSYIPKFNSGSGQTSYLTTSRQGVWRDVNGDGKADFVYLECDTSNHNPDPSLYQFPNSNIVGLNVFLNTSYATTVNDATTVTVRFSDTPERIFTGNGWAGQQQCGLHISRANYYYGRNHDFYSYGSAWLSDNPDEYPNTSALPKKFDFNGDGIEDLVLKSNERFFTVGVSANWEWSSDLRVAQGDTPLISSVCTTCKNPNGIMLLNPIDGLPYTFYGTGTKVNNDGTSFYANFNDDACTDLVTQENNLTNDGKKWRVHLSACNGTPAESITLAGDHFDVLGVADWDGDGRQDVLTSRSTGEIQVMYSTGNGFSDPVDTGITNAGSAFFMNVDGKKGWDLGATTNSSINYHLHGIGTRPDVLASVSDGFGNTHSPTYVSTAQSNYSVNSALSIVGQYVTAPISVVGSVASSDGAGGTYHSTYNYVGAVKDPLRGFQGFTAQIVSDDRANTPVVRTNYYTNFPYSGLVSARAVYQSDGVTPIMDEGNTASTMILDATPGNSRQFVYRSYSTQFIYQQVGGYFGALPMASNSQRFTYDTYGNLVSTETNSYDNNTYSPTYDTDWQTVVSNTFAPADTSNWCLNLPTQTTVQKTALKGWNGSSWVGTVPEPLITRTTKYVIEPNASLCRIKSSEVEPSGSPYYSKFNAVTTYGYDSFGNVNSETVKGINMQSRNVSTTYDGTGRFPVSVTNPMLETSTAVYDPVLGVQSAATDPNSLVTGWYYDGFGRVTRETFPDGTYKTVDRISCAATSDISTCGANDVRQRQTLKSFASDGTLISEDHVMTDMQDRTRFVESKGLGGTFSTVQTKYDALGQVQSQSIPYQASSQSPLWINYTYDIQGRKIREEKPINRGTSSSGDTAITAIGYYGLITGTTDAQGKTTTKAYDPVGRLRASVDLSGAEQTFSYDAFGSLTGVDVGGWHQFYSSPIHLFSATYGYGLGAFQIQSVDADRGTWNYAPNALGEVGSYTDAKSVTIIQTFDALSRPLTRCVSQVSGSGCAGASGSEGKVTWTWGTPATLRSGKLLQLSQVGGTTESYLYNNYGQLQKRSILSDAGTPYDYEYTYNLAGQLDTLTYPNITYGTTTATRLQLKHVYQNGILQQVKDNDSSGTVYWQANSANQLGEITNEQLGNGVTTTRSFDPATGWLNNIKSGKSSVTDSQSESYLYDKVGNLIQRANDKVLVTESFCYDDVYRLVRSSLSGDPACQNNNNLELGYDPLGRTTHRSDVANNATWTYGDPNHLHGVTQAGSASFTYTYDANGNATTRNGNAIAWNAYNFPTSIKNSATSESIDLSYDGNQQRWKSVYNNGANMETTYYIGGLMDKVALGGGNKVTYRHYIYGGSGTVPVAVVSRDVKNNGTYIPAGTITTRHLLEDHYLLEDQQDSVSSILNADGSTLVNESYTADGLRRNPTTWNGSASSVDLSVSAGVTRQGYTWQIALGNMGLNHMNGRVQDAITGVFLSPDPYISEPGNPQNYNRYSYVLNNPLSFTDPSGYRRKKKTGNISKKNQPPTYQLEGVLITAERYEPHYLSDKYDTVNFGRDLINGIADFLDGLVNSYFNSSSSGGDGKNTDELAAQTEKPCPTASPPSSNSTAVPFTDDAGNPVTDINGSPMQRPAGWDPHFFTSQGANNGTRAALSNFRIGGAWDAQRVGGSFHGNFTDFANVNIGLYSSAAGFSQGFVLSVANTFAAFFSYFGNQARDSNYPHLRPANVFDIKKGYQLQQSGTVCTKHN